MYSDKCLSALETTDDVSAVDEPRTQPFPVFSDSLGNIQGSFHCTYTNHSKDSATYSVS